jgi:DUF1009 family protein
MAETLGLIAGQGMFPRLVARGAKAAGRRVVCCGLGDNPDPAIRGEVDVYERVGLARLGQWSRVLRKHGVTQAVMVGRVGKAQIHSPWRYFQYVPDIRTVRVFFTRLRNDKRDHAVLLAVVDELAKDGIELIDSTAYCKEHLASEGVMTRRQPSEAQMADAAFGFPLCKLVSGHDIGQAIAVLDKDVLAVEAIEGTDRMIERAGTFGRKGWTMIKVANIHQDMRIDVPSIGVATIEKLAAAKCGCLVLEAGKTMMIDKPAVIARAEAVGLVILGKAQADPAK